MMAITHVEHAAAIAFQRRIKGSTGFAIIHGAHYESPGFGLPLILNLVRRGKSLG
jgi:hypothetical protein